MVTLSNLQCLKLRRLFNGLSSDRGQSLTADDFLDVAHRLAAIRGQDGNTSPYRHMLETQAAWWDKLRRTAGVDYHGRVHFQQWLDFWGYWMAAIDNEAQTQYNQALNSLKEAGEVTFDMVDVIMDGKVNLSEYSDWYNALRLTGSPADSFAILDGDHDGYILRDEVVRLVVDFYLSSDPDDPSTHLMGVLELEKE